MLVQKQLTDQPNRIYVVTLCWTIRKIMKCKKKKNKYKYKNIICSQSRIRRAESP